MPDVQIERLVPPIVDESLLVSLKGLSDARWHCILEGVHPFGLKDPILIVYLAKVDNQPVGLVLGSISDMIATGNLFSLYVHPDFRHQGIGSRLMDDLCEEFVQKDMIKASVFYSTEEPTHLYFEKILKMKEWYEPEVRVIRTTYDKYSFKPGWFGNLPDIPEDFELFKWKDLKAAEKQRLLHQQNQGVFPSYLTPFREEDKIEYLNSMGLRHDGEVIAWVVTHRIKPDTIRFTSLFCQKEFRNTGYAIRMVVEACKLQIAADIPFAVMDINVSSISPIWLKFMKTRMFPFSIAKSYVKESWKLFKEI